MLNKNLCLFHSSSALAFSNMKNVIAQLEHILVHYECRTHMDLDLLSYVLHLI